MKKVIYICSVVLPLIDCIVGTWKGLKKGLNQFGNERYEKEQEAKKRFIKDTKF